MAATPTTMLQDKFFARRLALMIESRLIDFRYFEPWTNEMILSMDQPPFWLLELSSIKYSPDAVAAINRFAFSELFVNFDSENWDDDYLACLLLRHERGLWQCIV